MKNHLIFLPIVLLAFAACTPKTEPTSLEIKDGSYYINGEKTFINALGYEIGARPGQHPYEDEKKLELKRMENDLRLIKEAGFNAIRTWSELSEPELKVVQESGLKIIYGIWVLPDGEFNDPEFIKAAEEQVKKTISFSKNYDCVITYLIMNEPMVAHIHKVGARETVELWKNLRDIIHEMHPGIPVTISTNSAIGEYINENIFDVYGFNAYDYNGGMIYTQTFGEHFRYLKELNGLNYPLLITEFGLSVSQNGYGMYGGNTLKKQAEHLVNNFSDVLDGGAAGACPFYFADGWWKAGDPPVHNPEPEEWFGYWGYANIDDTIGYPRPVWYALKTYNKAIIGSPRNNQIYSNEIPIELYLNDEVKEARIIYKDQLVYKKTALAKGYFKDFITFNEPEITDRELVFEFYDSKGELVKYETIILLTSDQPITLPVINVEVNEKDLSKAKTCEVMFNIENHSPFSLDNELKYLFSHHIGWDSGENKKQVIKSEESSQKIQAEYEIPIDCLVLTITAGIDIKYGKFVKRIHGEKILYRGIWAESIKVK